MQILSEARRYAVVGILTNLLNFGLFAFFFDIIELGIFSATITAYFLAILFSFVVTRAFVFPSRRRLGIANTSVRYVIFIVLSANIQAASTTLFYDATSLEYVSWCAGAALAAVLNFFGLRSLVFLPKTED